MNEIFVQKKHNIYDIFSEKKNYIKYEKMNEIFSDKFFYI